MSEPWFRFGKNAGTSGLYGVPELTGTYYLAYRSISGREEVTHAYDPATAAWSILRDDHLTITADANLFQIVIDGELALEVKDGVLTVNFYSEKGVPVEPSLIFYLRTNSTPRRLATLTKSGTLSVPKILEDGTFPEGTELFRFLNNSAVKATISKNGLQAASIVEPFWFDMSRPDQTQYLPALV